MAIKKNYGTMNIKQLEKEYKKYYDDAAKRNLIKELIQKRMQLEKIEMDHNERINNSYKNNVITLKMDDKNNSVEQNNNINNLLEELIKSGESSESEKREQCEQGTENINVEKKYQEEIDKDHTNNKLMERLNNELMFRNDRSIKELEKPYLSNQNFYTPYNSNNQIANLDDNDAFGLPNSDFTSEGILKKKF